VSRLLVAAELLLAPLALVMRALGVLRNPSLAVLLVGCVSLSLRRAWGTVGLRRPRWRALLLGAGAGVAYDGADILVVLPLLQRLTGQPVRLEPFEASAATLVAWLAVSWTVAALGEELAWRGYVLNRLTDLLGPRRAARAASAAVVAVLFGLAHLGQGATGVLDNVLAGGFFATAYLVSGRNLWVPIVAHGVADTTSFVLLFAGVDPGRP
jgi:membrane protease YdiL (CAAX protease family)